MPCQYSSDANDFSVRPQLAPAMIEMSSVDDFFVIHTAVGAASFWGFQKPPLKYRAPLRFIWVIKNYNELYILYYIMTFSIGKTSLFAKITLTAFKSMQ